MSDSLTIGADPAMQLVFHSRSYAEDGWPESYAVDLMAPNLRATVRVENPAYGHPPAQLILSLVPVWRGWDGKMSWRSMEGELEIDVTSDRTGHISLLVRIPGYMQAAPWSVEAKVVLEAGQIEAVAHAAETFFARRAE